MVPVRRIISSLVMAFPPLSDATAALLLPDKV
jgi:hypothetical protein